MSGEWWPWLALALLGTYHGANPAMGWLFAVARGLQEGQRSAVLAALAPIALGHGASVLLAAILVGGVGLVAPSDWLRPAGAMLLVAFGLFKLLKPRAHPRWVGLRVSLPELALWSFLTSTAHGAGLMLIPVLLSSSPGGAEPGHAGHLLAAVGVGPATALQAAAAASVHTLAMLAAMAALALLVYDRLGLAVLRRAWLNLDALWALALLSAGLLALLL